MIIGTWNDTENIYVSQEDLPVGAIGFVYEIRIYDESKSVKYAYIGKKNVTSTRKRKFGKKEAALVTDKRKKLYEMVTKPSDWSTYCSSNKTIKDIIKNQDCRFVGREILGFAYTKKHLTYLEIEHMFKSNVLSHYAYLNDNILGKFFDRDVEAWERVEHLPF